MRDNPITVDTIEGAFEVLEEVHRELMALIEERADEPIVEHLRDMANGVSLSTLVLAMAVRQRTKASV